MMFITAQIRKIVNHPAYICHDYSNMINFNDTTNLQNDTYYTNEIIRRIIDSRISSIVSTSQEITIENFLRTFILSLIFLLIEIIMFLIVRNIYRDIYRPKTVFNTGSYSEISFFKFLMKPCSKYKELEDLDAYLLLRFLKLLILYFSTISLLHLPCLIPIHYYYYNNDVNNQPYPSLDIFNISNVPSNKMGIHLLLCILDIIWFHILLMHEAKIISSVKKHSMLKNKYNSIIYVENFNRTFLKNLNLLNNNCGVKDVFIIHKNYGGSYRIWSKAYNIEKQIERITYDIISDVYYNNIPGTFIFSKKSPKYINYIFLFLRYLVYRKNHFLFLMRTYFVRIKCGYINLRSAKTDGHSRQSRFETIRPTSFRQFRYEQLKIALEIYNNTVKILKYQETGDSSTKQKNNQVNETKTPKRVVIEFASPREAHIVSLILAKNNVTFVKNVLLNPNAHDMRWISIIYSSPLYREIMRILSIILSVSIIVGWVIPIAFIGFFAHIPYMTVTFLRPLSFKIFRSQFIRDGIENVLPLVTLIFFTEFVPYIFRFLSQLKGCRTGAEIEKDVQKWLFVFLFVHLFLVVTASSGISLVIERLINSPNSIPVILASELPKSSSFFCSFIIIRGISYFGGNILRIRDLLVQIVYYTFINYTPHVRINRIKNSLFFNWGSIYPLFSVLGCIGIAYGLISPLILPISFLSNIFIYFSFKYLFEYQYIKTNHSDTFGDIYQYTLLQLYIGIYFMEFSLLGLFVLSDEYKLCLCTLSLFIATVIGNVYFRKYILRPILFESSDFLDNSPTKFGNDTSVLDAYRSPLKKKSKMYGEIWLPTYPIKSVIEEITVIEQKYGIVVNTNKSYLDDYGNLHFR